MNGWVIELRVMIDCVLIGNGLTNDYEANGSDGIFHWISEWEKDDVRWKNHVLCPSHKDWNWAWSEKRSYRSVVVVLWWDCYRSNRLGVTPETWEQNVSLSLMLVHHCLSFWLVDQLLLILTNPYPVHWNYLVTNYGVI